MVGIPLLKNALQKVKQTPTQVGLTLEQREENLTNAFRSEKALVAEKNVLVIDDVVTTGSTLHACAQSLKRNHAKNVYGLTPARKVRNIEG
jgi:predicted amidophosphoribosyltransferase